jgi:hypothetical protein
VWGDLKWLFAMKENNKAQGIGHACINLQVR